MANSGGPPSRLAEDAVSIWTMLLNSGLEPRTYDKDLVDGLCEALNLNPRRDVASELRRANPTVVEFLGAFLSCCKAFDEMAQGVWDMFVNADARFSSDNLQIAFDFSKDKLDGLKFNLDHFRAFMEEYRRFRESVLKVPFNNDFLWGLRNITTSKDRNPVSRTVAEWANDYDEGRWPSHIPQLPVIGDAGVDLVLRQARQVVSAFVSRLTASGVQPRDSQSSYEGRMAKPAPVDGDLLVAIGANHDRWPKTVLVELDQLAHRLTTDKSDVAILEKIGQMEKHLRHHLAYADEEALRKNLEEFLNLPLWKARDQLFGLWTCAQITAAVGYDRVTFHTVNGGLHFRFRATHVATVRVEPPLHLFAELRTSAARLLGHGRTRGIQPDWRLVREPVSEESSQLLILECKQYARPSRRNFLEAVIDYATNSGDAKVALVNYGDMNADALLKNAPPRLEEPLAKVRERITLIGSFRPAEAEPRQRLKELVSSVLPVAVPQDSEQAAEGNYEIGDPEEGSEPESARPTRSTISLWWDAPDVDLDLTLVTPFAEDKGEHQVSYRARGRGDVAPWAALDEDIQSGGARPEVIHVTRWLRGAYRVLVTNFTAESSRNAPKYPQTIRLEITIDGQRHEITPNGNNWITWRAADIAENGQQVRFLSEEEPEA